MIDDGRPRTVSYTADFNGQVMVRNEEDQLASGDPREVWYYFGGKLVGYTGNNGTSETDYAQSISERQIAPNVGQFRSGSGESQSHADFV